MSFLRDYATFTEGNECPPLYHTWCALSTISSLVSRKCWMDQGIFPVHANMYVMLVGMAGIRKSTAMKQARKLVREIGNIGIAPASITKEAISEMMGEEGGLCKKVWLQENLKKVDYSHLSIFANEISSLLNAGGNAAGMIDFLTDIWDQDVMEVKTKNKGHDIIIGPFITILGCLTIETMTKFLFEKVLSGGFNRRCIFVYAEKNGPSTPRPTISKAQKEAWDRCVVKGKKIHKTQGEFLWGAGSEETFDTWYNQNYDQCAHEASTVLKCFYQSKGEYVLKVAMLIALSETEDKLILPEHITAAIEFLTQTEPGIVHLFEGTGRNELSPIATDIERFILAMDEPIKVKTVYRQFYNNANHDEIDKIIQHLDSVGKVEKKILLISGTPVPIVGDPEIMKKALKEGGLSTTETAP